MSDMLWTKVCCYILLGLAAAIIIFNLFIPATTFMLFLPWILIFFAYMFIFMSKIDIIIKLLKEGRDK